MRVEKQGIMSSFYQDNVMISEIVTGWYLDKTNGEGGPLTQDELRDMFEENIDEICVRWEAFMKDNIVVEFMINNDLACADINADFSGIDEVEEAEWIAFQANLQKNYGDGHITYSDEVDHITCEVTGYFSVCRTAWLIIPKKSAATKKKE